MNSDQIKETIEGFDLKIASCKSDKQFALLLEEIETYEESLVAQRIKHSFAFKLLKEKLLSKRYGEEVTI